MKMRALMAVFLFAWLVPASLPATVPLPADLAGELNGQAYRIRVPANWNGTLLVYSYGYAEGYELAPLTPQGTNAAGGDEAGLLGKGYALAGIRAAGAVNIPGGMAPAGWNMRERMQSQVALVSLFRDTVGQPERTIAWGKSMGGLVALALIEKHPALFDGAVPLCAPAAGTPRSFDQKLDIVLAYKAAFQSWQETWGTPGALRPDLDVLAEVYPNVLQQATKKWRWEFLRMVNHIAEDPSFYGPMNFRFQVIWLGFAPLPDMDRRAGGHVAQNIGRVYTLTAEEKAKLIAMGGDPEPLLQAMNEEAIYAADRNARLFAEHYYEPSGQLKRPVLMLHTTHDAAAIPENEGAYGALVGDLGLSGLLMQAYTTGVVAPTVANTHCTFLPAQYIKGIDAMDSWLRTGEKPDAATYFSEAAGFDTDYVAGEWPW